MPRRDRGRVPRRPREGGAADGRATAATGSGRHVRAACEPMARRARARGFLCPAGAVVGVRGNSVAPNRPAPGQLPRQHAAVHAALSRSSVGRTWLSMSGVADHRDPAGGQGPHYRRCSVRAERLGVSRRGCAGPASGRLKQRLRSAPRDACSCPGPDLMSRTSLAALRAELRRSWPVRVARSAAGGSGRARPPCRTRLGRRRSSPTSRAGRRARWVAGGSRRGWVRHGGRR